MWDRWKQHKRGIRKWSDETRVRVALACVDRTFWRLRPHFNDSAVKSRLPLVRKALDLLWAIVDGDDIDPDSIREIDRLIEAEIPGDDDAEIFIFGWSDTLNAIAFAIRCARGIKTESHCLRAMEYAYYAVREKEVLSTLTKVVGEEEFVRIEKANDVCMADLKHQLEAIKTITAGQQIPRLKPRRRG